MYKSFVSVTSQFCSINESKYLIWNVRLNRITGASDLPLVIYQKVRRKPNFAQVGIECAYGQRYMYIKRSPVEIQNKRHLNLIGYNMIAPPPLLSPSSILPPHLSRCAFFPARKNSTSLSKMLSFQFFYFFQNCVILKMRNLQLHKVGKCLHCRVVLFFGHTTARFCSFAESLT